MPDDDGLWLLDAETGSTSLLVSLQQMHRALHQGPLSGRKDSSTGHPYNNTGVTGCRSVTWCRGVTGRQVVPFVAAAGRLPWSC